jgi:tetratricopeptide (TPR) repeat protein
MRACATGDLPAGARAVLGESRDHKTLDGWPMTFVEAELVNGAGEVVESRLCAFYFFLEHATFAIARAPDRARMAEHARAVLTVLESGRPDWRGEPICLAEVWDLEPPRPRAAPSPAPAPSVPAVEPTAQVLQFNAGVALGREGRHAEAIDAWQKALAIDPTLVDAHYNIGQAHYRLHELEAALAAFAQVVALEPHHLRGTSKVIQCLYGLGRVQEGEAARGEFRRWISTSGDPRARLLSEIVFDQFAGNGFRVHAAEALRGPTLLQLFRAVDDEDRPLRVTVQVETSEVARKAGTPYVLAVVAASGYKVVDALAELPSYPLLKTRVSELIGEVLGKQPKP